MTDQYTSLVKAAYDAQQARDGEEYQRLTSELAEIDREAELLAEKREATTASLERMDGMVESTRDALDAYFEALKADGRAEPAPNVEAAAVINGDNELFEDEDVPFISFGPVDTDEFSTPKPNGAYAETGD